MKLEQSQNNFIPKYYNLKQMLINDIEKGVYLPNMKIPSVIELMKKYVLSSGPVKRTISELAQEGLIYTLPGKGCFVSARSAGDARNNETKQIDQYQTDNKRIVYISPHSINDEYYYKVQKGILEITQLNGYELIVYDSEYDYNKETDLLTRCLENPPAGILFIPRFYEADYKHLFYLRKRGIPVVLLGSNIKRYDFDWVGVECGEEGLTVKPAINYLIKSGHRNIAFLGMVKDSLNSLVKFNGYRQALKDKKIKFNPELILDYDVRINNIGPSGYKGLKKLLSDGAKFTAIFAVNDSLASQAYRVLKEKGIKVPGDVSIIGCDDLDIAKNFEVPLTTLKHDIYKIGKTAAKLLLKRIDDKLYKKPEITNPRGTEKISIGAKLIIRDSVKEIKSVRN